MASSDGGKTEAKALEADWKAALLFLHKGPSASLQFVKDEHRAQLHAYQVSQTFPIRSLRTLVHTYRRPSLLTSPPQLPTPSTISLSVQCQASQGPCREADAIPFDAEDGARRRRREAWLALGEMGKQQAKREFVDLLSRIIPDWRSWQGGERSSERDEGGGLGESESDDLASRLVRQFMKKTGAAVSRL